MIPFVSYQPCLQQLHSVIACVDEGCILEPADGASCKQVFQDAPFFIFFIFNNYSEIFHFCAPQIHPDVHWIFL